MPASLFRQIHDAGVCLCCTWYWWSTSDEDRQRPTTAELGVFLYDHLCENWISGPYGLRQRPAVPLHIDQLPPAFRARIKQARFDRLRFAETIHIQPVEHMECISWEDSYLCSDGKTQKPMPGREEEFDGDELVDEGE